MLLFFATLVLQSSTIIFMIEGLLFCHFDILVVIFIIDTTRKMSIDEIDTNGALEKWCATTIY